MVHCCISLLSVVVLSNLVIEKAVMTRYKKYAENTLKNLPLILGVVIRRIFFQAAYFFNPSLTRKKIR